MSSLSPYVAVTPTRFTAAATKPPGGGTAGSIRPPWPGRYGSRPIALPSAQEQPRSAIANAERASGQNAAARDPKAGSQSRNYQTKPMSWLAHHRKRVYRRLRRTYYPVRPIKTNSPNEATSVTFFNAACSTNNRSGKTSPRNFPSPSRIMKDAARFLDPHGGSWAQPISVCRKILSCTYKWNDHKRIDTKR